MIKNKFIKGLLWCIVGIIYYGLVVVVHDDSKNNAEDIKALETHIAILELDVVELQDKLNSTQLLTKSLRKSIQITNEKCICEDNTATGNVGVLTNDKAIEEQLNDS